MQRGKFCETMRVTTSIFVVPKVLEENLEQEVSRLPSGRAYGLILRGCKDN